MAEEPAPTGDRRWDALLAATAAHLCYHHASVVPAWTLAPSRFLE